MSRSRMAVLTATMSLALLPAAAGTASAQAPTKAAPLTQKVKLTGTKGFTGSYAIERFVSRGGKLYAVGTLKGRVNGRRVTKENVSIPAALAQGAKASQIPPTPGACQILNLTLQPIDLNLLGLRIRTSRIDLRIEGVRGPGNLLGNLLCGITGILDPNALQSPANQLAAALNAILALVPRS